MHHAAGAAHPTHVETITMSLVREIPGWKTIAIAGKVYHSGYGYVVF